MYFHSQPIERKELANPFQNNSSKEKDWNRQPSLVSVELRSDDEAKEWAAKKQIDTIISAETIWLLLTMPLSFEFSLSLACFYSAVNSLNPPLYL